MKYEGVRFISNGVIKKAVVSKEADFGARRKTFVDVVNVDKEEEGTHQDGSLGDSREDRAGVRKCAVNKDMLCAALQKGRRPVKDVAWDAMVRHLKKEGGVVNFVESFGENSVYLVRLVKAVREVAEGVDKFSFTATALAKAVMEVG